MTIATSHGSGFDYDLSVFLAALDRRIMGQVCSVYIRLDIGIYLFGVLIERQRVPKSKLPCNKNTLYCSLTKQEKQYN